MKRIVPGTLLAALILFTFFHTALAASIVGKWTGTLSAGKYKVSASVRFTESDYRISAAGITSSGSYSLSGKRITLNPSSPPGFSKTTMSISLKGSRLTIKGSVAGLSGTLSLKRKGGSSEVDPSEEPIETPAAEPSLSPEDQAALERMAGRWTGEWQGQRLTLIVYRDGWAALLLDGDEDGDGDGPSARIYGAIAFEDGRMMIRQALDGAVEEEPVDFPDLMAGGERPNAPLLLALPYEMDPDDGLMYLGEEKIAFSAQPDTADYSVHPDKPNWKEEELSK